MTPAMRNPSPPIANGQPRNGKTPPMVMPRSERRDGSGRKIDVGAEFGHVPRGADDDSGSDGSDDDSGSDGSDDSSDGANEHKAGSGSHDIILAVGESASDTVRPRQVHRPPASYPTHAQR